MALAEAAASDQRDNFWSQDQRIAWLEVSSQMFGSPLGQWILFFREKGFSDWEVFASMTGWWFGTFLFSHILGTIVPTDVHIFSEGLKPPTRWFFCMGFLGHWLHRIQDSPPDSPPESIKNMAVQIQAWEMTPTWNVKDINRISVLYQAYHRNYDTYW